MWTAAFFLFLFVFSICGKKTMVLAQQAIALQRKIFWDISRGKIIYSHTHPRLMCVTIRCASVCGSCMWIVRAPAMSIFHIHLFRRLNANMTFMAYVNRKKQLQKLFFSQCAYVCICGHTCVSVLRLLKCDKWWIYVQFWFLTYRWMLFVTKTIFPSSLFHFLHVLCISD